MERLPLAERSLLDTPALLESRTHSNPRGQLGGRRKYCSVWSDFSDDLLCRVDLFYLAPLREESAAGWLRADR
jgi:hypothetical protein